MALDLDTGNAERFDDTDGVPGDYPFRLTALESGMAYPGSGGALSLPRSLEGPPATIGEASYFVPSGRADRLWLVDPPIDRNTAVGLREVDVAGEVRTETAIPQGSYPVGGVGNLVIVQQVGDLAVVDPASQSVVTRTLGPTVLLARGGDRLAVVEVCDTCAGVRVIDLSAPNHDIVVGITGNAADATFSPERPSIAPLHSPGATDSWQETHRGRGVSCQERRQIPVTPRC